MKKNVLTSLLAGGMMTTAITGCKKVETITIQQPVACFTSLIKDPLVFNYQSASQTNFTDSTFYFKNCSDSSSDVAYKWTFGDGSVSTLREPVHAYKNSGKYNVILEVNRQNLTTDTIQKTISVIIGQKHISIGERMSLQSNAICETASGDFTLLANYNYGTTFYWFTLDSLMRQKAVKIFPPGYRFWSMLQLADGTYLLTGNTSGNIKNNELIKVQADGTIIWEKTYNANDNLLQAVQTPDGGFAIIGQRPGTNPLSPVSEYAVVIKTDNNGNSQWQKPMNMEGVTNPYDIIAEPDGLVFGGSKPDMSYTCQYCDSAILSKLGYNGTVQWKKTAAWGLNYYTPTARTTRLNNGNYIIASQNQQGIYFFSSAGQFLDRKLTSGSIQSVTDAGDGNLLVLQTENGNGYRIKVSKISPTAAALWSSYPEGRQRLNNGGVICCTDSRPMSLLPLRNGGYLVNGSRYIYTADGNYNFMVVVLLQLDNNGNYK